MDDRLTAEIYGLTHEKPSLKTELNQERQVAVASGPQVKDDVTMCGLLVYECMYLHKASLEIWPQIVESLA